LRYRYPDNYSADLWLFGLGIGDFCFQSTLMEIGSMRFSLTLASGDRRLVWCLFGAAALMGISSCATPYTPYAGDDAGRLRLRLAPNSGFGAMTAYLHAVNGGQCGPRIAVPGLAEPLSEGQVQRQESSGRGAPAIYPRADMHDSSDPSRTGSVELRLSPAVYALTMVGTRGGSHCVVGGTLEVSAKRQYDMDFSFTAGQCIATVRRLEAPLGPQARLQWARHVFEPNQLCTKKS
jgi:hypothetical protein